MSLQTRTDTRLPSAQRAQSQVERSAASNTLTARSKRYDRESVPADDGKNQ